MSCNIWIWHFIKSNIIRVCCFWREMYRVQIWVKQLPRTLSAKYPYGLRNLLEQLRRTSSMVTIGWCWFGLSVSNQYWSCVYRCPLGMTNRDLSFMYSTWLFEDFLSLVCTPGKKHLINDEAIQRLVLYTSEEWITIRREADGLHHNPFCTTGHVILTGLLR